MATTIDTNEIIARATPAVHQEAHEIQPFGHLVKMPIALAHATCAESVENLNQLLADTITLRDLYKKHHWQLVGPTFYQLRSSMRSQNGSRCWAESASQWRQTWPRRR
jgi:starvation-inducible DNA-binding protein